MEILEKILTYLGGLTGLATLIIIGAQFMGKKWIDYWFEKKNKAYQHKNNELFESHKAELNIITIEHQNKLDKDLAILKIRLTPLHKERLIAISEVYVNIVNLHDGVEILTSNFGFENLNHREEVILPRINEAMNNLKKIWIVNSLFFPKELADTVADFIRKASRNSNDYVEWGLLISSDTEYLWEKQEEIRAEVEKLKEIVKDIENNFRSLLGVE